MKKVFIGLLFIFVASCSSEKVCNQTWQVSEYCTTTSGCNIVGCQTPTTKNYTTKCEEFVNVSAGDVKLIRAVDCAKFYRKFIKKID